MVDFMERPPWTIRTNGGDYSVKRAGFEQKVPAFTAAAKAT